MASSQSSYQRKTLVLFCAFFVTVTSAQHPSYLPSTKDDTNLRLEYETLKTRFEDFVGAVEVQFDRLKEEIRQLKTKVSDSEKDLHNTGDVASSKGGIPRSCHEARLADPSLSTGVYWIDPDGQNVGDDPIQVNCDMSSGMTIIGHDTEASTNVGHCTDPGCYTKPIVYQASLKQIAALTQLSSDCRQSIKYECYSAPLQFDGVEYSWWNDRNGNEQYYWHGSDNSTHMCLCGIAKMCADPNKNCNCDADVPINLVDEGEITSKESLPITRLNFGRTIPAASSGIHTLGKLKCSGQKLVDGMPTSCVELWQIGHVLNGLYLIKGASQVETVYCDFSKASTDAGFETWIGFVDVKSSSAYFHVQRTTIYSTNNTVIPFENTRTNVGNAMDPSTGIFTAPRPGKYFFGFSAIAHVIQGTNAGRVDFQLNGVQIAQAYGHTTYDTIAHQSTLQLKKGDQITLFLVAGAINDATGDQHTTFVGWLVEEDDVFNV